MAHTITEPFVLAVEGVEETRFFSALALHLGLTRVYPHDMKGKAKWGQKLTVLKQDEGFENVRALGLVRDADDSPEDARRSVRDALRAAGLPSPDRPLTAATSDDGRLTVAFMILPDGNSSGALENLCLRAVRGDPATACVELYFECIAEAGLPLPSNMPKIGRAHV